MTRPVPQTTKLFRKRIKLTEHLSRNPNVGTYYKGEDEMVLRDYHGEFKTHGVGKDFREARANCLKQAHKSLCAITRQNRMGDWEHWSRQG